MLPPDLVLDPWLTHWLQEDIGRGDRTTQGLGELTILPATAVWIAKAPGVIAGLSVANRTFQLLDVHSRLTPLVAEGEFCSAGKVIAELTGPLGALLMGERVALNLAMRLGGIATVTRQYADKISDLPAQLVDTRKTTPGLRSLEKYATWVGGAKNHRMGLDDSILIKDNHIAAAGGIQAAVTRIRHRMPYPLMIEVEVETLEMVLEALSSNVDIIMLDNMSIPLMQEVTDLIRHQVSPPQIEASGNITLETIRAVAETGVDYISTSAPITQAPWLDLSMKIQ